MKAKELLEVLMPLIKEGYSVSIDFENGEISHIDISKKDKSYWANPYHVEIVPLKYEKDTYPKVTWSESDTIFYGEPMYKDKDGDLVFSQSFKDSVNEEYLNYVTENLRYPGNINKKGDKK